MDAAIIATGTQMYTNTIHSGRGGYLVSSGQLPVS